MTMKLAVTIPDTLARVLFWLHASNGIGQEDGNGTVVFGQKYKVPSRR